MSDLEMKKKRPVWISLFGVVAVLFGILSVKEGGEVLFTEVGHDAAGRFVPFVVWFNFLAGFAYIVSGVVLLKLKSCSKRLSAVIAAATIIVFMFLGIHIFRGGEYELRTVIAMAIRSILWISIATAAFRSKVLNPIDCKC